MSSLSCLLFQNCHILDWKAFGNWDVLCAEGLDFPLAGCRGSARSATIQALGQPKHWGCLCFSLHCLVGLNLDGDGIARCKGILPVSNLCSNCLVLYKSLIRWQCQFWWIFVEWTLSVYDCFAYKYICGSRDLPSQGAFIKPWKCLLHIYVWISLSLALLEKAQLHGRSSQMEERLLWMHW